MKKSKKQESLLIQLLKEMAQGETLDHIVQRLQQELGAGAPTADAVRGYLLHSGDSVGLDAYQRALVIDQLLECVEVNFRTLCDLIRYRYLKAAGMVDCVEEFLTLTHPDETADLREEGRE